MDEREQMRLWVENWRKTGPLLAELRREDIRATDTPTAMQQLGGLMNHAIETLPPRTASGLVEMQRLFAKLRQ